VCTRRCLVSYEIEDDNGEGDAGDGGGIYFDEEVREEDGESAGRKAGGEEGSAAGREDAESEGGGESWRKVEEWVHCRYVRLRSVKYLAGE